MEQASSGQSIPLAEEVQMARQNTFLENLQKAVRNKKDFPLGVLVYYGPDDQTISKIVAVVLPSKEAEPILQRWQSDGIASDPQAAAEIGQFFKSHQTREVVMTEGVVGCPHEEGVDYPQGEDCPHCPFWSRV